MAADREICRRGRPGGPSWPIRCRIREAMLSRLLHGTTRESFFEQNFQKQPHAEAGSAADAAPLMSWDKVAALIAAPAPPDMIVSRSTKFLSGCEPRTIEQAQELFASGCSIVLRSVDLCDDEVRGLAEGFRAEMDGEVTVHAFATPRGFPGFGWHYDCEDVFIIQSSGVKQYFLRENTVNPRPTRDAMPADMQYEKETTQTIECTLVAGDWLYIPRGWWHMARARDDSLSMSVGVMSPAAAGLC
jgi:50S ribosomal protein L16 3-hydroxylase